MTIGLLNEVLCLEKTLEGFYFVFEKCKAGLRAYASDTKVAHHAVNALFFVVGPLFGVAGSIDPIACGILRHAPVAEGVFIGAGAGLFEDGLHCLKFSFEEKHVTDVCGIGAVMVGVGIHALLQEALGGGGFESRGVAAGTGNILGVVGIEIHVVFPPVHRFVLHSDLVYDVADTGAVGGAVAADLGRGFDPGNGLADDLFVLEGNEPIPGVVVAGTRVDGKKMIRGCDRHFLFCITVSIGRSFEPLFRGAEILGKFLAEILVMFGRGGTGFPTEVMAVNVSEAREELVALLLGELLLEKLLTGLSGFPAIFISGFPELGIAVVLMGTGCRLPGAFVILFTRLSFPDTLLKPFEVRKGLGAGDDGREVFFETLLPGSGGVNEADDLLGPSIVGGGLCEVFVCHVAGLADVLEAIAIDINGENGAEGAGAFRILSNEFAKSGLGTLAIFAAPEDVGARHVLRHDIVSKKFLGDFECTRGVASRGSVSRATERVIAIAAIGIGSEIAAGFGLNFGGSFLCSDHGFDEIAVKIVFAGAESFAVGLDGVFELSEAVFEASGAMPEVAFFAFAHRSITTDQRLGNLQSFGPLLGAFGGVKSLETNPGKEFIGGELGDHFGSELCSAFVGIAIVGFDEKSDGLHALTGGSAVPPDFGTLDSGVTTATRMLIGCCNAIPDFIGERMFRENLKELPAGDKDVFVPGCGGIPVDLFERHGSTFRVLGLRP